MKKFFSIKENGKYSFTQIFDLFVILLSIITYFYGLFTNDSYTTSSVMMLLVVMLFTKYLLRKPTLQVSTFLYFLSQSFIFLSMYVGRILDIYNIFNNWDKFLHTYSGFILFFLGVSLYFLLEPSKNINFKLLIIFALVFAISMAGIWEIYEYATDHFLGLNSQNSSLDDTMQDMIVGTLGTLLGALTLKLFKKNRMFVN